MAEQYVLVPLNGCRYCGLPEKGSRRRLPHCQRWSAEVGWHTWTQPTQKQIKQRMLARRKQGQSASLVIIDEAVNFPTTTERTNP
ncbi:hypothetical protein [Microbispora bryophytorum]|uniref:hypothetical protein n=1 Tax=Microbispora bryophytorum TaxID=1460882 RepID=UPI0033D237E5